jgi:hypothetical protein
MQIKPFPLGTGIRLFTILIVITLLHLVATATANAADGPCANIGAVTNSWRALDASGNVVKEGSGSFSDLEFENGEISTFSVSMDISKANVDIARNYELRVFSSARDLASAIEISGTQPFSQFNGGVFSNPETFRRGVNGDILGPGNRLIYLHTGVGVAAECLVGSFNLSSVLPHCTEPLSVYRLNEKGEKCFLDNNRSCADPSHDIYVEGKGLQNGNNQPLTANTFMPFWRFAEYGQYVNINNGSFASTPIKLAAKQYTVNLLLPWTGLTGATWFYFGGNCATSFTIENNCAAQNDRCDTSATPAGATEINFDLCSQASKTVIGAATESPFQQCTNCFSKNGIWTAVGCIETKPQSIIQAVVKIGVGIGGGIALLMTLVGGFLLTTSQGDPKRTQEGKEMITSSVIGILFVLFSVVILQFIGVTIFRIPGFGT